MLTTIVVALINAIGVIINTIIQKTNQSNLLIIKSYLVRTLSLIELKKEVTNEEMIMFWELYDLYTKKYNGNSYIHTKVEDFKKKGMI